jgi:hypothetical protein
MVAVFFFSGCLRGRHCSESLPARDLPTLIGEQRCMIWGQLWVREGNSCWRVGQLLIMLVCVCFVFCALSFVARVYPFCRIEHYFAPI